MMTERARPVPPFPMRVLLFVPGNRSEMLAKARSASPDVFVPDLEDSVPPQSKDEARRLVREALPDFASTGIPVIPRLNSTDTEWLADDIEAVVGPDVAGVSVGKIRTPDDIARLDEQLTTAESRRDLAPGSIALLPWIETASAVLDCREICAASPRIIAVGFGAEDLTLDMEIRRGDDAEVSVARSLTCLGASAAGVPALDTPFFAFRDDAALRGNAAASKRIGFKGKFAIHPAQIDTIRELFSPSDEELREAREILTAFERAAREGAGSVALRDRVVDVPVAERARRLLRSAGAL